MRESDIQKKVVQYARSKGILAYKFNSDGHRAVPDYLFIGNNKMWFIEFKATGKVATALQLEEHKKIRSRGTSVYVIDDILEGVKIIDWFNA